MPHCPSSGRWPLATALLVSASTVVGFGTHRSFASEAPRPIIRVAQTEKPSAEGTINAVDASKRKLNITHGPVAALNWPGMTMDFSVAPGIDISALKAGAKIFFTLGRDENGQYMIDEIRPVK